MAKQAIDSYKEELGLAQNALDALVAYCMAYGEGFDPEEAAGTGNTIEFLQSVISGLNDDIDQEILASLKLRR